MLRYVFRIYRKKAEGNDEDWHAYLSRANAKINQLSHDHGMQEWVETQKRRKWRFAGRLARAKDNRWSRLILDWAPYFGLGRAPGHPVTRWADQLDKFAGGAWMDIAADEDQWAFLEEGFVTNEGIDVLCVAAR